MQMNNTTETDLSRRGRSGGKLRSDSKLGTLTPEQRARVDQWLFVENDTYTNVVKRCQEDFKLGLAKSSLARYYRSQERKRELSRLAEEACARAGKDGTAALTPRERYELVLDGVEKKALELAQRPVGEIKVRDLAELVHLLIAARREANEASRVALAREKLEYDVAAACLRHKLELDRICEDKSLDDGQKIRAIREEFFGPNLPE
jgi:hypothetical protein